jgi:hypothetical protein
LLSGVVISFDRFNPSVSKPVGVPLMGEVMASRWAFEACMVTQFRDNPFEKQFYELDKIIAQSDYKKVYYIPKLESKLAYCLHQQPAWRNDRDEKLSSALALLHREIENELLIVGKDKLPENDRMRIGGFDSTLYERTTQFFAVLKRFYTIKMNRAIAEKEKLVASLRDTPEKAARYSKMHDQFVNAAVSEAVKNMVTADRIIEFEGRLVQKIYPIYQDEHRSGSFIDFSANLFQPTKYFAGRTFNTLLFNLVVIWSMTFFLFVTLYFDVVKNVIRILEGNRKFRRRDRL